MIAQPRTPPLTAPPSSSSSSRRLSTDRPPGDAGVTIERWPSPPSPVRVMSAPTGPLACRRARLAPVSPWIRTVAGIRRMVAGSGPGCRQRLGRLFAELSPFVRDVHQWTLSGRIPDERGLPRSHFARLAVPSVSLTSRSSTRSGSSHHHPHAQRAGHSKDTCARVRNSITLGIMDPIKIVIILIGNLILWQGCSSHIGEADISALPAEVQELIDEGVVPPPIICEFDEELAFSVSDNRLTDLNIDSQIQAATSSCNWYYTIGCLSDISWTNYAIAFCHVKGKTYGGGIIGGQGGCSISTYYTWMQWSCC